MLYQYLRDMAAALNGLILLVARTSTATPTAGTWVVADFVRNSAPVEAGTAGAKYVVLGWVCTVSGTPGTWLPTQTLTGN
jgi:hypothetical protein